LNYDLYFVRGMARSKIGLYIEAIQDFNEAVNLNPNNADIYDNRGYVKYATQDYAGAIKDYGTAIELLRGA
jgi:tetratricopeptide (TPR) repeat protein